MMRRSLLKQFMLLAVGIAIGAVATQFALSSQDDQTDVELRVWARGVSNDRTELSVQYRQEGHEDWSNRLRPRSRILPAEVEFNTWYYSSPVTISIEHFTAAEATAMPDADSSTSSDATSNSPDSQHDANDDPAGGDDCDDDDCEDD